MVLPRTYTSGMRQKRSPSCGRLEGRRRRVSVARALDVHITSRKCRFIHVSQLTRLPLYVSPFFSSCSQREAGANSFVRAHD